MVFQPRWGWLESMAYNRDPDSSGLGAPRPATGWRHGMAGSVRDDRRVDCWLLCDHAKIQAARFEVFAGPAAMTAAEWLAGWLAGRSPAAAAAMTGLELARRTELADEARSDALCIEDALRAALSAPPIEGGRRRS